MHGHDGVDSLFLLFASPFFLFRLCETSELSQCAASSAADSITRSSVHCTCFFL
jgi:hypothetical protein